RAGRRLAHSIRLQAQVDGSVDRLARTNNQRSRESLLSGADRPALPCHLAIRVHQRGRALWPSPLSHPTTGPRLKRRDRRAVSHSLLTQGTRSHSLSFLTSQNAVERSLIRVST